MKMDFNVYPRLTWWHPQDILQMKQSSGRLRVLVVWFSVCAVSIISGLASTSWNSFPLNFGIFTTNVSIYPPLTLCLLLTFCIGPAWGIIPAFFTSFFIALQHGMPILTAALFGLATPVTLTVLWSSMAMMEVSPAMKSWRDQVRFAILALIATGASSVGALVWNYHHSLQFTQAQAVWRGWVLGDFIQIVLIVGPLLYFFHNPVKRWLAAHISAVPRDTIGSTFYVTVFSFVLLVMIAVGAVAGNLFVSSLRNPVGKENIDLAALHKTLEEAVFFVTVYAIVFLASVIVFSSTLGSHVEHQKRDIAERKRVQEEHEKLISQLQEALSKVKLLSGMLPICANCKKIRNDQGYWTQIESYVRDHSEADFTHGICPQCMDQLYPNLTESKENPEK